MKKNFFAPSRLSILLLSFLLPVAVLLAIYSTFGIYPFGDKSLLIMDLNGQSVDFYAYIRDLLWGDSSFIYSFAKGPGGNMVGLLSYYGAFPFTLLTALFPKENMQEAVLFVNLLLVGLSGLTMCILLHSRKKEWDYSLLIFSVSYALMSYSILYSMQMQWLCGVLFLPLIILGIDRIVEEGNGALLSFFIHYSFFPISIRDIWSPSLQESTSSGKPFPRKRKWENRSLCLPAQELAPLPSPRSGRSLPFSLPWQGVRE